MNFHIIKNWILSYFLFSQHTKNELLFIFPYQKFGLIYNWIIFIFVLYIPWEEFKNNTT